MKKSLSVILLLFPLAAFSQNPLLRNFFTTNTAPVVQVTAGSNAFVTFSTTEPAGQVRTYRIDVPTMGGTGSGIYVSSNYVTLLSGVTNLNFIGATITTNSTNAVITITAAPATGVIVTNTGDQPVGGLGADIWAQSWGVSDAGLSGQYMRLSTNRLAVWFGLLVNRGGITNDSLQGDGFFGKSLYSESGNLLLGPKVGQFYLSFTAGQSEFRTNTIIDGLLRIGMRSLEISNYAVGPSDYNWIYDGGSAIAHFNFNKWFFDVPVSGNFSNSVFDDVFTVQSAVANFENDLTIGNDLIVSNNVAVSNNVTVAGAINASNSISLYSVDHLNQIFLNTNGTIWVSNRIANCVPLRIDRYVLAQTTNLLEIKSNGIPVLIVSSNGNIAMGGIANPGANLLQVGGSDYIDQYGNFYSVAIFGSSLNSSVIKDRYFNNTRILMQSGGLDSSCTNQSSLAGYTWGTAITTNLLAIYSNGIPLFVVRSNGNVGILNSAPQTPLDVTGGGAVSLGMKAGDGYGFSVGTAVSLNGGASYGGDGLMHVSGTANSKYGRAIIFSPANLTRSSGQAAIFANTNAGVPSIKISAADTNSRCDLELNGAIYGTNGGVFSAPVITTSSSTNDPAPTEFVVGGWVRGLFINGFVGYNSSNAMVNGTISAEFTTNFFEKFGGYGFVYSNTAPDTFTRVYPSVTNNQYLGAAVITNLTQIQGPIVVSSYIGYPSGGGRSLSVKPEIYYTYGTNGYGTNELKGDWDCGDRVITAGATNRYDFVVPVPLTVATSGTFTLVRTFKVTAQTANPNVTIGGGTNFPSQLSYNSVMSPVGQTVYASNILSGGAIQATVPLSGTYVSNACVTAYDISRPRQFYSTNDNLTFTDVSGVTTANEERESSLTLVNTKAGDITLTIPNKWKTPDGLRAYTVTNGQCAELSVKIWAGSATNAAVRMLR